MQNNTNTTSKSVSPEDQIPIVRKSVRLPLHKHTESSNNGLEWSEFEDLCVEICEKRHKIDTKRFGRSGQKQDGIDFYTIDNSHFGQCKRQSTFTVADLKKAVENYKAGQFFAQFPKAKFSIWVANDVNDAKIETALISYRQELDITLVDQQTIETFIHDLDPSTKFNLVGKYWGEKYAHAFCGTQRDSPVVAVAQGTALHAGGSLELNFRRPPSVPSTVPKGVTHYVAEGIGETRPNTYTQMNFF